jgi:hypothetical protein
MPAVIFLHTHITTGMLNRIGPFFKEVVLCLPWFIEPPHLDPEKKTDPVVHVRRPPDHLKPEKDFVVLLSEYRSWMEDHMDKGHAAFLRAANLDDSEETPWQIRQVIRQMRPKTGSELANQALKWHLLLHLAREAEEHQMEVNAGLDRIKQLQSPLAEALAEDGPTRGLLDDLTSSPAHDPLNQDHLPLVMDAWFGLFQEILDGDMLLTLDQRVLEYAAGLFEDNTGGDSGSAGTEGMSLTIPGDSPVPAKRFPPLADSATASKDRVRAGLAGKTLVLL